MIAFIVVSFLVGAGVGIELATWLFQKDSKKHFVSDCLPPLNTVVHVSMYFENRQLDCMLITYGERRKLKWQCVSGSLNGHIFPINKGDIWEQIK